MGYLAIASERKKSSVVILVCNPAFGKQRQEGMNCTKRWRRRRKKGRERREIKKQINLKKENYQ